MWSVQHFLLQQLAKVQSTMMMLFTRGTAIIFFADLENAEGVCIYTYGERSRHMYDFVPPVRARLHYLRFSYHGVICSIK